MKTALYVLISICAFGVLIFIHEGGHFLFARIFKVTIKEFSIGMGPKLLTKKSKKTGTSYSLRALPIGGFVNMAGEDEESDDPNGFTTKPVWQRFIIVVAGAATNLVVGFIVMAILVAASSALGSTTVADFNDEATSERTGLMLEDEIIAVNGTSVHIADELVYEIMRYGIEPIDITVIRDGEKLVVEDVVFPQLSSSGVAFGDTDFRVYAEYKTFGNLVKHSFYKCEYTVRMVWESLYDLVRGRYSIEAVSGPIGATKALSQAAETSAYSFISLVVIISINLGIMNLMPFPALDGGKLIMLIIEAIIRRPLNKKVEAYINLAGITILLAFMLFICVKDIIGLF